MKKLLSTLLTMRPSILLALVLLCISGNLWSQTLFTESEIALIESHGPWPQHTNIDPSNELAGLDWAEALGKQLFFDKSLSFNNTVSCGSCHQPEQGFSDGEPVAVGVKRGIRNTQGLLDMHTQHWFGWDGGADSLWAASIRPMLAEHEMGNTVEQLTKTLLENTTFTSPVKSHLGANALENTDDVLVIAAKSIAAYTLTLRSGQTPFDLFRNALIENDTTKMNAYPEAAKRGLKIFLGDANCFVCHFGPAFSNGEFHDTGRPFFVGVGEVDPGRYRGIQRAQNDQYNLLSQFNKSNDQALRLKTSNLKLSQSNWGQWRTPTLRNLTLTAPYTHDGSLNTLREVVDWYADIDPERLHADGESLLKPLGLSDGERDDLVQFMRSLSVEVR